MLTIGAAAYEKPRNREPFLPVFSRYRMNNACMRRATMSLSLANAANGGLMNAQSGKIPQYPADFPTSLHTPAPRSWLRRNWLWLLAGLFAGGLLFVFGLFTLIFSAMRNSDVAKGATTMAQSNSVVLQRLGSPIEEGFFVSGSVNVGEGTGDADLSVPISGPKGKATVSVTAHKSAGVWNYNLMQVGIASTGERSV
jgi:hypothetical protein